MIAAAIRKLNPRAEIAVVIALFAGLPCFDNVSAAFEGYPTPEFSDASLLLLVIFELFCLLVGATFLYVRGWRVQALDFDISWVGTLVGLLLYGTSLIIHIGIWDLFSANAAEKTFLVEMHRAISVSLPIATFASVVNGFYEEVFLTGYLLKAFQAAGAATSIGVSVLIRLFWHIYEGPLGMLLVLAFGLVLSLYYWRYRCLWPIIIAHIFADITAFA